MSSNSQWSGVLSGRGALEAFVRTYTAPAPFTPPAHLRERVEAVTDHDGSLRDWAPVRDGDGATSRALQQWRASYVLERSLGDVATFRAFLSWASRRSDVSALTPAAAGPVSLDPATASRAAAQATVAGALARADASPGFGLARADTPGLVRAFVWDEADVVVLAAAGAQLSVTELGLVLTTTPAQAAPLAEAGGGAREIVRGWSQRGDGLHLRTQDGTRLLPEGPAADLLVALAPGAGEVSTHAVPVTSVFASALTALPAVLTAAARSAHRAWLDT